MLFTIFFSNEDMWKQAAFSNIYFELAFLFNNILFNKSGQELCWFADMPQLTKDWQNCDQNFASFATLAGLLPWLRVLIPCLAVLLPGLVDLLSKYWKILDWCFLYSIYVCLVLLKYLGIQQWNDFPVGVSDYARKTNYDWLYIICEKNYSKACVLSFLQSPSGVLFIICLQVLTFSFARVADLLTWLAVLLPGLVDLVSKYWKIWGWHFLYSIYVY